MTFFIFFPWNCCLSYRGVWKTKPYERTLSDKPDVGAIACNRGGDPSPLAGVPRLISCSKTLFLWGDGAA